jgi:hypothetical protein
MYRKDVNEASPLRILDRSIHGGLGKGNLGVVMARAGSGKTACLVQIALDDLMHDKDVLHVAVGQALDHVQSCYDALFDDLATYTRLEDREEVRAEIFRHRVIKTFADGAFSPRRLEQALTLFEGCLDFHPQAILVDGFHWEGPVEATAAALRAIKATARRIGAELWMTAQTHREAMGEHPRRLVPPCEAYAELIDVALFLEPHGPHRSVRLLKDHGDAVPPDGLLLLDADTMRLVAKGEAGGALLLPPSAYTLLSGGAEGAEAEFGACAEKWGLGEVNYSFAGRTTVRERGLALLTEEELRQGDVSSAYLSAQMHRTYPATPLFRKVLQTIWHQVNTAGEVFTVGVVLPDNTVKGGTGWAAELAKHWGKPVRCFDQERGAWYRWHNGSWVAEADPVITRTRFTGTGTRFLSERGREAIQALYERSFGQAKP